MSNPEKHPDRPLVRDIYAAQQRGFPICDQEEFGIYYAALTSVEPLDDPATTLALAMLATQARQWIEAHDDLDAWMGLRADPPPG